MKLKKIILGTAFASLLLNGACGKNSDNHHGNPTYINYIPLETSNNFKVGAEIEDGDGIINADIRFYDSNNDEIGYMPMNRVSGNRTRGIYETPDLGPMTDTGQVIFEVSVVEGSGAHLRLGKQKHNVYLSDKHAREAICDAYTNHQFDDNSMPTGTRTNLIDVVNGTDIEFDVAVDFNAPLTYNGIPSNSAIIYFNYVAINNDNAIDPAGDQNILDNGPYNGIIRIPVYIDYDNLGTPTTRSDIAGIVDSVLTYEDSKIVYQ